LDSAPRARSRSNATQSTWRGSGGKLCPCPEARRLHAQVHGHSCPFFGLLSLRLILSPRMCWNRKAEAECLPDMGAKLVVLADRLHVQQQVLGQGNEGLCGSKKKCQLLASCRSCCLRSTRNAELKASLSRRCCCTQAPALQLPHCHGSCRKNFPGSSLPAAP
jgi:hypothetical protein